MSDYIYKVGEVISLNNNDVGLIVALTNACEYMALEKAVKEKLIEQYINIRIYKVIINSTISYIHETNIKGTVCTRKDM